MTIHLIEQSTGINSHVGSIPGSGRSPGEGNGNPVQYFSLENPMDRGAWQATVHGITRVGHGLALYLSIYVNMHREKSRTEYKEILTMAI